ncbi:MAG: hypothetical protein R3316_08195 [Rhodovibrionaceae bacterium]|nr:hypothetical protein [Rhodovibrionaceae bacterium]
MTALRNILISAIGLIGAVLIIGTLFDFALRLQSATGLAVLILSVAISLLLHWLIRRNRAPFRLWYALPIVLGGGVGLFAETALVGWFSDIGALMMGLGTGLLSFAVLQLWADTRGKRDWYALLPVTGLVLASIAAGVVDWLGDAGG